MTVEELLKKSLESHTGEELEGPIEDVAVIVSFLGKDVFIEIGEFEGDEDESASQATPFHVVHRTPAPLRGAFKPVTTGA